MRNGPYALVLAPKEYPGKKYRDRYCYEHHLVWWRVHRFIPEKGYEIHHLNHDHRDNHISNLKLVTSRDHRLIHGEAARQKAKKKVSCGWCKKDFFLRASSYKSRMKINKFGKVFCSQSCGAKHQFSDAR